MFAFAPVSFTECLDGDGCYDFVINDEWDDGMCCQQGYGSYSFLVNGTLLGGKFGTNCLKQMVSIKQSNGRNCFPFESSPSRSFAHSTYLSKCFG